MTLLHKQNGSCGEAEPKMVLKVMKVDAGK
jgi:hypothetical protein